MKALMMYDYAKGKWQVMNVAFDSLTVYSADTIKRMFTEQGKYLWPKVINVQIKSFEYSNGKYSATFEDDFEFPEVETLEQSIQRTKKILQGY
jgi:hypothetical protein